MNKKPMRPMQFEALPNTNVAIQVADEKRFEQYAQLRKALYF
jgi:hypothetical protein